MQTNENVSLNARSPYRNLLSPDRYWFWLLCLLAVGLFLRIALFWFRPSIYWADEIFQTQEPAHRLAYGIGVITWEFRLGLRSWVLPAFIAGIMKSTAWLASGSSGYIFATAFCFALLSLSTVCFAFFWSRQYFGIKQAWLAALTATFWFELIHLGARSLSEIIATHLFLPALFLGSLRSDQKAKSQWRLVLVGMLLGATVCLRLQFAPAVLLAGIWILSLDWKARTLPVSLGAFAVLLLFGGVDAITWRYPFYSYYAYFREDIIHHRAAGFGVLPWYYYLGSLFVHTGPLPLFALLGVRRSPILGWICLAVLIPHSFIAHKEFRYIYPVLPLLLALSAAGLFDVFRFLQRKTSWHLSEKRVLLAAAAIVVVCSFLLASRYPRWGKASGGLETFRYLSKDSEVCGVAVLGVHWWDTGGYTYLHRPVPIYLFPGTSEAGSLVRAFDRVVAPETAQPPFPGYAASFCRDGVCVYSREGDCVSDGKEYTFNEVLKRKQQ